MPAVVVVGMQFGDEGKGKITDYLADQAAVIVRYQGGSNAGHTVVVGGAEYRLHQAPSGILSPGKTCVIGNGVVVDPAVLIKELDDLESRGHDVSGLRISHAAHVLMPYHARQDELEEEARGTRQIGTTKRGIGPAYTDKYSRGGIRFGDLLDEGGFRKRLEPVIAEKNRLFDRLYGAAGFNCEDVYEAVLAQARRLLPCVTDTARLINEAIAEGEKVLFEGAQGTFLDIDHGTYPYVTSSNPTAGGACTGAGVGPTRIDGVIGIVKAYTSRVGSGPFPTELLDEKGASIREKGGEYGTTTGRPRRIGWLDTVMLRYAAMINGVTGIALTKVDTLADTGKVKICAAYQLGSRTITEFPTSMDEIAHCEPIYEEMDGWSGDEMAGATTYDCLPAAARRYISRVEELTGVKVALISAGRDRRQTIRRSEVF